MNAHDPKLHEQQQKLGAIKARLDRQEKLVSVVVIVAMILCVLALVLFLGGGMVTGESLQCHSITPLSEHCVVPEAT